MLLSLQLFSNICTYCSICWSDNSSQLSRCNTGIFSCAGASAVSDVAEVQGTLSELSCTRTLLTAAIDADSGSVLIPNATLLIVMARF